MVLTGRTIFDIKLWNETVAYYVEATLLHFKINRQIKVRLQLDIIYQSLLSCEYVSPSSLKKNLFLTNISNSNYFI